MRGWSICGLILKVWCKYCLLVFHSIGDWRILYCNYILIRRTISLCYRITLYAKGKPRIGEIVNLSIRFYWFKTSTRKSKKQIIESLLVIHSFLWYSYPQMFSLLSSIRHWCQLQPTSFTVRRGIVIYSSHSSLFMWLSYISSSTKSHKNPTSSVTRKFLCNLVPSGYTTRKRTNSPRYYTYSLVVTFCWFDWDLFANHLHSFWTGRIQRWNSRLFCVFSCCCTFHLKLKNSTWPTIWRSASNAASYSSCCCSANRLFSSIRCRYPSEYTFQSYC